MSRILEIGNYDNDIIYNVEYDSIVAINSNRNGVGVVNNNGDINNIFNKMRDGTLFDMVVINTCNKFEEFTDIFYNIKRFFHKGTVLKISLTNHTFIFFKHYQKHFDEIDIKIIHDLIIVSCKLNNDQIIDYTKNLPTIITSLYDIRSLESNNKEESVKRIDMYFELGKFILSLEYPLIIYTEEKLKDRILSLRPQEYHSITTIKTSKIEDIYYYRHLDTIKEYQNNDYIKNRSITKDTALYVTLVNNKFWFMEDAINNNYHNSDRFIWLDFGINHVAENPESIRRWFRYIPDKIRCMESNLNLNNNDYKEYFQEIRHNVVGGIITGSQSNMLIYIKLCQERSEKMLTEGWYQLEEAVMGMVTRDNPNLFDTFYGSFNNCIAGYDHYVNLDKNWTINTINYMINFCLDKGNHKKCYSILQYLKDHFLYSNNKYAYLEKYIICNYYVSDTKSLDEDIIISIFTDKPNINFITKASNNLKFYSNLT